MFVLVPRPEGEQSQALGTYLGGSQLIEFRCSPWYFLVTVGVGPTSLTLSLFFLRAQFVLFCSVDPFCFSSFVFSFRVFCPRGLSALRAASFSGSSARVHVVWDSSLWFIWCHPFGRGCCGIRIIAKRFICYGLGQVKSHRDFSYIYTYSRGNQW